MKKEFKQIMKEAREGKGTLSLEDIATVLLKCLSKEELEVLAKRLKKGQNG